jgi:hypothetical protein
VRGRNLGVILGGLAGCSRAAGLGGVWRGIAGGIGRPSRLCRRGSCRKIGMS